MSHYGWRFQSCRRMCRKSCRKMSRGFFVVLSVRKQSHCGCRTKSCRKTSREFFSVLRGIEKRVALWLAFSGLSRSVSQGLSKDVSQVLCRTERCREACRIMAGVFGAVAECVARAVEECVPKSFAPFSPQYCIPSLNIKAMFDFTHSQYWNSYVLAV